MTLSKTFLLLCLFASSVARADITPAFCRNRHDGLYPDPASAQRYYYCFSGQTYYYLCRDNYVFHINKCLSVSITSPPTSTLGSKTVNCVYKPDGTYPDPADCHSYYLCLNGVTYHRSCTTGIFKSGNCVPSSSTDKC